MCQQILTHLPNGFDFLIKITGIVKISTVILFMLSAFTHAAVVYDEDIYGDLPDNPPQLFTLGNGYNTVSGRTDGGDLDEFELSLASSTQRLVSLQLNYSTLDATGSSGVRLGVNASPLANTIVIPPGAVGSQYYTITDYSGGPFAGREILYSFSIFGAGIDYTIVAQVTPVPLPAGAWLFLSAILSTVFIGERRLA